MPFLLCPQLPTLLIFDLRSLAAKALTGNLNLGGFGLVIEHRDDVTTKTVEPGRCIVNFAVEDIEATAAHLRTLEVEWLVHPEDRGVGWFATLIDPDGNYVQLIQMKPEYYAGL